MSRTHWTMLSSVAVVSGHTMLAISSWLNSRSGSVPGAVGTQRDLAVGPEQQAARGTGRPMQQSQRLSSRARTGWAAQMANHASYIRTSRLYGCRGE
jgi:hypothetical protein